MIDSTLILPVLILLIFIVALCKRVPAYSVFLTGVKDGMGLFLDIYPALLAMMCAISLLRESGLMDIISGLFQYISTAIPSQQFAFYRSDCRYCGNWYGYFFNLVDL